MTTRYSLTTVTKKRKREGGGRGKTCARYEVQLESEVAWGVWKERGRGSEEEIELRSARWG